jgi:hypothetical protein
MMVSGDLSYAWAAAAWIIGIFAVFMPLAVWQYARVASE